MALVQEKFSQDLIEGIQQYLINSFEQNESEEYEILVDKFKVVKRTKDIARFEQYENFVKPTTKTVTIIIYEGSSNRNTKHILYLSGEVPFGEEENKNKSSNTNQTSKSNETQPSHALQGLSGFEIDNRINEKVKQAKDGWQMELLEKELSELKIEVQDLQDEIDDLEEENEALKTRIEERKNKLGELHLGDIAGVAIENIVRRNPEILEAIPGAEGLAGLVIKDNAQKERLRLQAKSDNNGHLEEGNISIKSKTDNNADEETNNDESSEHLKTVLNPEEQNYFEFIQMLRQRFKEDEMDEVFLIIESLAKDKRKIKSVINLIAE
jgi:FtsZ-binding cell division protein ZapB